MKKSCIKIVIALTGLISVLLYGVGCCEVAANANENKGSVYLVLGLDDAAQNADIIMLVGVSATGDELSFLQIPRDTYYRSGGINKLNGVYSSYRSRGKSETASLSEFSEDIADAFGIGIDGAFAVTVPAFLTFVDTLGGITVDMPYDYTFYGNDGRELLALKRGDNLLRGKDSELFVRYRSGYLLGDLSRMDAQKIFLSGVVKTVKASGITKLARAAYAARERFYTTYKFSDFLKMLMKKPGRNKDFKLRFSTLPGVAVTDEGGVSYFSVNLKSADELIFKYFSETGFDKEELFLNRDNAAFCEAYYGENVPILEYSDGSFGEIKLR